MRLKIWCSGTLKTFIPVVPWSLLRLTIILVFKLTIFWNVIQCSLVGIDRRIRCVHASIHRHDNESKKVSETSDKFHDTTRCNIPEDSQLGLILSDRTLRLTPTQICLSRLHLHTLELCNFKFSQIECVSYNGDIETQVLNEIAEHWKGQQFKCKAV